MKKFCLKLSNKFDDKGFHTFCDSFTKISAIDFIDVGALHINWTDLFQKEKTALRQIKLDPEHMAIEKERKKFFKYLIADIHEQIYKYVLKLLSYSYFVPSDFLKNKNDLSIFRDAIWEYLSQRNEAGLPPINKDVIEIILKEILEERLLGFKGPFGRYSGLMGHLYDAISEKIGDDMELEGQGDIPEEKKEDNFLTKIVDFIYNGIGNLFKKKQEEPEKEPEREFISVPPINTSNYEEWYEAAEELWPDEIQDPIYSNYFHGNDERFKNEELRKISEDAFEISQNSFDIIVYREIRREIQQIYDIFLEDHEIERMISNANYYGISFIEIERDWGEPQEIELNIDEILSEARSNVYLSFDAFRQWQDECILAPFQEIFLMELFENKKILPIDIVKNGVEVFGDATEYFLVNNPVLSYLMNDESYISLINESYEGDMFANLFSSILSYLKQITLNVKEIYEEAKPELGLNIKYRILEAIKINPDLIKLIKNYYFLPFTEIITEELSKEYQFPVFLKTKFKFSEIIPPDGNLILEVFNEVFNELGLEVNENPIQATTERAKSDQLSEPEIRDLYNMGHNSLPQEWQNEAVSPDDYYALWESVAGNLGDDEELAKRREQLIRNKNV